MKSGILVRAEPVVYDFESETVRIKFPNSENSQPISVPWANIVGHCLPETRTRAKWDGDDVDVIFCCDDWALVVAKGWSRPQVVTLSSMNFEDSK